MRSAEETIAILKAAAVPIGDGAGAIYETVAVLIAFGFDREQIASMVRVDPRP